MTEKSLTICRRSIALGVLVYTGLYGLSKLLGQDHIWGAGLVISAFLSFFYAGLLKEKYVADLTARLFVVRFLIAFLICNAVIYCLEGNGVKNAFVFIMGLSLVQVMFMPFFFLSKLNLKKDSHRS